MMICLEGGDAAGKKTQSLLLAQQLPAKRYSFPDYTTPSGKLIHGHLQGYWSAQFAETVAPTFNPEDYKVLDARVFQALQLVNRIEMATQIAKDASREHVVLDRYWPSAWVYGTAQGMDSNYLEAVNQYLPEPDLYVLLDSDFKTSRQRRPERRDLFEKQDDLMEKCDHLYRTLWYRMHRKEGRVRWTIVDGRGTVEEVNNAIHRAIDAAGFNKARHAL